MKNKRVSNRRSFIKSTTTGVLIVSFGAESVSGLLSGCNSTKKMGDSRFITPYEQSTLPYRFDALEDVIDAQTMEIHYSKHAAGYAKNLADAMAAENADRNQSLETLLSKIAGYSSKMRNNAGGHYNHEMFWQCMRPKKSGNSASGKLLAAIEKKYGSFNSFKTAFTESGKARFGSGWIWLVKDDKDELAMGSTANQDNPLMDIKGTEIKGFPLLCLDVWEHAYYLKYQQKRADYIKNWWDLVNWDYVQSRYEHA
jgi:Fe-Mn family superoxide dismutase